MTKALYRGFSLHELRKTGSTKLFDLELVKMNLLSHIYTLKGERLGMADFGTRIPELVFEQLDSRLLDILDEDLRYVFNYDPRVRLDKLSITPFYDRNAVLATAELTYIELNIAAPFTLHLEFK